MVRAVLFDLDGVLVDTYDVWFHLMNDVARRLGYPEFSRDRFHPHWGQGIEADAAIFYPRHAVADLRRAFADFYGDHLGHLKVMEGARETLSALNVPTAVVTNSLSALARRALSAARLDGFFDAVVGSDEVARSKPAPDMVLEACRRLEVQPAEVVFVGDSRYDEEAARAAGAPFVKFRSFAELRL